MQVETCVCQKLFHLQVTLKLVELLHLGGSKSHVCDGILISHMFAQRIENVDINVKHVSLHNDVPMPFVL